MDASLATGKRGRPVTEPIKTTNIIIAITTDALYDLAAALAEARGDYLAELFGQLLAERYVAELRGGKGRP